MSKSLRLIIILFSFIAVTFFSYSILQETLAEGQTSQPPITSETSILEELFTEIDNLGFGTEAGSDHPIWNRILSSGIWVPGGNASNRHVLDGKTFYSQDSREVKTGTYIPPDPVNYEAQSLTNRSASWSQWTRTNTNPQIWKDERTGLYWTGSQGSYTNEFILSTCNYFTTDPRGDYDGLDSSCGDAINLCANLSLPTHTDALNKTNWYLPTETELRQARMNGIFSLTNSTWVSSSYFWSSTEYVDGNYVHRIKLNNFQESWGPRAKTSSVEVRCVLRDY